MNIERELAVLSERVKNIDDKTDDICKILSGKDGLVTQTEVNRKSIKVLYWLFGGAGTGLLGILAKVIFL